VGPFGHCCVGLFGCHTENLPYIGSQSEWYTQGVKMEYVVEYTFDQIRTAIGRCRERELVLTSSGILERYIKNDTRVDAPIPSIGSNDKFETALGSLISITTETIPEGADANAKLVVDLAFDYAFVDVIQRLYSIVTREKLTDDVVRQIVRVLRANVRQSFVERIERVFDASPHPHMTSIRPHVISAVSTGYGGDLINAARHLSSAYDAPDMKKRGIEQGGSVSDNAAEKRVKMTEVHPVVPPLLAPLSLISPAIMIAPPLDPARNLQVAADLITSKIRCSAREAVVIASAVALAHLVYDIDVKTYVGSANFHGDVDFNKMAAVFVLLYSPSAWKGIDGHNAYPIKCAESDGYLRGRLAREFYCAYVAAMAAHDRIDVPVPHEHVLESEDAFLARIGKSIRLADAADRIRIRPFQSSKLDDRGMSEADRAVYYDQSVTAARHAREKANAMHILTDPTRAVSWCRKQLERLEACIDETWDVYSPLSGLSRRFRRDLFDSARAEAIRLTFSRFSSIVAARTSSVDTEAMEQAQKFFDSADMYTVAPGKAISDEIAFFGGARVSENPGLPINPIIQHMMTHPRSTPGGILETVKRPAVQ
jgi:hypothetical protein